MQPRTRADRLAFRDKEALERSRLEQRTGGYHAYENIRNPVAAPESAPGYVPENVRLLHGLDQIDLNQAEREAAYDKKLEKFETHRAQQAQRDAGRWAQEEEKDRAHAQHVAYLQQRGNRSNLGGAPYNIVTSAYEDSGAGKELRYRDDMVLYRSELRSADLAVKTGAGFNPLTQERSWEPAQPSKPQKDW